jgi:hypothetical protein
MALKNNTTCVPPGGARISSRPRKIFKENFYKGHHIKIIDSVVIIGTILFIASFVTYARPLVIAPLNNLETTNNSVLFEFERGNIILIDDNLEFSSPQKIYAEDNLIINLKTGKYFWKIDGLVESEIRELTIISEVNLRFKKIDDKFVLVNSGNVKLNVDVYDNESLVDNFILDIDDDKEINGNKFVGEQND